MEVFYSDAYVSAQHAWDTTRKSKWVAESLKTRPIHNVKLVEPQPACPDQLAWVHAMHYVEAVMTGHPRMLATSNGFDWCPNIFHATAASTGGVMEAVKSALRRGVAGSLSSGLHHAGVDHGGGFCTFNGLMVAAFMAVGEKLAKRVLILDYDAHFGDGTIDIIHRRKLSERIEMVDVSTGRYGVHVQSGDESELYLAECRTKFQRAIANQKYDLVIYNAGADPHEDCTIGGLDGVTTEVLRERDRDVFSRCYLHGIPVAFVLAGGYSNPMFTRDDLVECHRNTIAEAVRTQ